MKKVMLQENTGLCMRKTSGAAGQGKMREVKKQRQKREEEKEEKETVTVKRRCEGCVSVEAFEIFSEEGDMGSCRGFSWVGPLGEA